MAKTAVYLAGFYIIYFIFLSRDTMYTRNRAFIILSVVSSFILPLISVNVKEQSSIFYFGKTLSEVFVTTGSSKVQIIPTPESGFYTITLPVKIYLSGIIVLGTKLLADILNLIVLIARNRKKNDHIVLFKGFNTSGFSAMGYIFINKSLGKTESDEIIRHEQNHLDNNHFLDILLIEAIKVLQWFNPFIYLINRSLRAIHEYQADQKCLQAGMPVARYQSLLLNNVFRSGRFSMSNSFSNPSLIKKRMLMMIKKPSENSSSFKILLAIPVTVLFLLAISSCEKNIKLSRLTEEITLPESSANQPVEIARKQAYSEVKKPEMPPPPPPPVPGKILEKESSNAAIVESIDFQKITNEPEAPAEVFVVVEEMPVFPGGETELMKFIYSNIVYPEKAAANGIQGRVILRFCVTYKGGIDQVQVLKPIDPELDTEAVRVVKLLPKWTPGKQGGKQVNVWYSIPVTFQIKNQ